MANSSSIESNVSGVKLVKANQYAGGFAGRATLGYGMAVGSNDEQMILYCNLYQNYWNSYLLREMKKN